MIKLVVTTYERSFEFEDEQADIYKIVLNKRELLKWV